MVARPNKIPQYFAKDGKQLDWSTFTNTIYGEDAKKQVAYTSFSKISHNLDKYKKQINSQKKKMYSLLFNSCFLWKIWIKYKIMNIEEIENTDLFYEDKKFNLKFEKKIPVLNGCKYKFVPTIKIAKNKLEKAIDNSLLKKYLREVYLIGVSFIE